MLHLEFQLVNSRKAASLLGWDQQDAAVGGEEEDESNNTREGRGRERERREEKEERKRQRQREGEATIALRREMMRDGADANEGGWCCYNEECTVVLRAVLMYERRERGGEKSEGKNRERDKKRRERDDAMCAMCACPQVHLCGDVASKRMRMRRRR